jgi:AraC family transcriptional regulator, transcriptional activator of pobA
MKDVSKLLHIHKQNNQLPILLIAPGFGHLPSVTLNEYGVTHRKPYYFFLFMMKGTTCQQVDLQQFEVTNNQLLFMS